MGQYEPAFTFALALVAGMAAQVIARHLRIPGIVLLLLCGVLLGPEFANVVRPQSLGSGLRMIVAAAVAVILFEGGLHLDLGRLRSEAPTIRRLVTIGALITATAATLAAHLVMGWSWTVAIPFGTLVIVTGPTVIGPLLRRIRVTRNVHTVLEAEGVLIDPIGAIIAVVALEAVLAQELSFAAQGLLGIPSRLLFGTAAGLIGGLVMAKLLDIEGIIPEGLESTTTLSLVLALHAVCEVILPESGIMAAPVAGVVVGNTLRRPNEELKAFKQQLSVLLVGLLFVLLAADVRIAEVTGLGWAGAATVGILMFIVRPLDVAISTIGSGLTFRERAFVAWLGPRGIVAAAVASVFADHLTRAGVEEGLQLRALVFLVIATTVVVQGLTGNTVARLLRVRRRSDTGYAIAGANPLARAVATALRHSGEEVVLIDSDVSQVAAADAAGLTAVAGNALDEEVLERIDLQGHHGVIGLISNEAVTLLFAQKARGDYRLPSAHIAVRPGRAELTAYGLRRAGARLLFGTFVDIEYWSHQLSTENAALRIYRYVRDDERPVADSDLHLHIAVSRRDRVAPVDEQTRLRANDLVYVLCLTPASPHPDYRLAGHVRLATEQQRGPAPV